MRIVNQSVALEFITPDAACLIERAGRTCYKSADKINGDSAAKFIRMLLTREHHSVIEHAHATFRVICDRGVSHEFVRHRLMSYSQESTRYCNYAKEKYGNEITVIEPPGLQAMDREEWLRAVTESETVYLRMIDRGCKPEIARSVLPTCLKTELVATANFREWMHFLKMRTSPKAHPQMREVAMLIRATLANECPSLFVPYVAQLLEGGDLQSQPDHAHVGANKG